MDGGGGGSQLCVSAVTGEEDGAGMPKVGVVSADSDAAMGVGGVTCVEQGGKGGAREDDQREEVGHMQMSGLQAKLVKEIELKRELAVKVKRKSCVSSESSRRDRDGGGGGRRYSG